MVYLLNGLYIKWFIYKMIIGKKKINLHLIFFYSMIYVLKDISTKGLFKNGLYVLRMIIK